MRRVLKARWLFPLLILGLAILAVIEPSVSASKQSVAGREALARVEDTQTERQPATGGDMRTATQPLVADDGAGEEVQSPLDTTQCGTY